MKKYFTLDNIIQVIISLFIGASLYLKYLIGYDGKYPSKFINTFHFDFKFFIVVIVLGSFIFLLMKLLFYFLDKIKVSKKEDAFNSKKLIIWSFVGILISGVIFLLVHYPGTGINDTLIIIESPIGTSGQHTLFYNLFIGVLYRVFFKIFGSSNLAFFMTSVSQLIVIDFIITTFIYWFNKTFKNKKCTLILLTYYVLVPIISNYNTVLLKDSLFGAVCLLLIPILYEIITSKGKVITDKKFIISSFIILLLTIYIRNNGLYVVIFTLFILLIVYRKYWKYIISLLLVLVVLSKVPSILVPTTELFQEKIGIPIQQISYVVKNNYESISKEDKKYLNKILDKEEVAKNYNPYTVDTIKWHKDFDRMYLNKTSGKYLKTWFRILTNNFEGYVKSYLLTTYELWSFEKFNPVQSRFLNINDSDYSGNYFDELDNKRILPKFIHNALSNFYDKTTVYFGTGSCFIILLVFSTYLFSKKKKLVLLVLPFIGIWLTLMISAPIAYALRYMSAFVYSLPVIMMMGFVMVNKKKY